VRFGPWHPLTRAAETAPGQPGVLQARAEGLLPFPGGKSAMVLYAASAQGEPLAAFVAGQGAALLAAAEAFGACWVRYAEAPDPDAACARLLRQFLERFGALPPANGVKDTHV
jgi:hypothetical protein